MLILKLLKPPFSFFLHLLHDERRVALTLKFVLLMQLSQAFCALFKTHMLFQLLKFRP